MENSSSTGAEACIEFEEGDGTGIPVPHQAVGAKNVKKHLLFSDLPVISFSHTLCCFLHLCAQYVMLPTPGISFQCLVHLSKPSSVVTSSRKLSLTTHTFALPPKYLLVSACSSDHFALSSPVSTTRLGAA